MFATFNMFIWKTRTNFNVYNWGTGIVNYGKCLPDNPV